MDLIEDFSFATLAIYVGMALLIALFFYLANKRKSNKAFSITMYVIISVVLIIFSVFRYIDVDKGIGGSDVGNYLNYFENAKYIPLNLYQTLRLDDSEWIFFNLLYVIRLITSNYIVMFVVVYVLIVVMYIYFASKNFNKKNWWIYTPIILLPILMSFNLIRNIMSVAVVLFAIEQIKHKKYLNYFMLITIAFMIHYSAIIMYAFGIYYILIYESQMKTRNRYIISTLVCTIAVCLLVPVLNAIALKSGYNGYVGKEFSLWGYLPIIIECVFVRFYFNELKFALNRDGNGVHFAVYEFTVLTLPAFIFVGGANRFHLYLELSRIVIVAYIVDILVEKIKNINSTNSLIAILKHEKVIEFFVFIIVLAYIVFKILRIGNSYGIVPYYNILFM